MQMLKKIIPFIIILSISLSMFAAPVSIGLEKNQEVYEVSVIENYALAQGAGSSALLKNLESCWKIITGQVTGCVQLLTYFVFVSIPSTLMAWGAQFFDFMAGLTLSSDVYKKDFIATIWGIVRDFANIFFILILLYAAIQIILDLGHGGGKKMVAMVILVALLVNFSLFFTKVVIDSSNIVALIFYNKIDTSTVVPTHVGSATEKDIA